MSIQSIKARDLLAHTTVADNDELIISTAGGNTMKSTALQVGGVRTLNGLTGHLLAAPFYVNFETKSANYTVTADDGMKVFLVNGKTITLPNLGAASSGLQLTIINTDTTGLPTILAKSGITLNSKGTHLIEYYDACTIFYDGSTNWHAVGNLDIP